ncbi:Uma2 family endonuclease [Actinokineospora alba]|nr:Uma2 family endonuclease [Actinokineospora alba]
MNSVRPLRTAYDPRRRYSAAEFTVLTVDGDDRHELHDGLVTVSPTRTPIHMRVLARMFSQIDSQISQGLRVFPEVGIVVDVSSPTVRVPDLVITTAAVDQDEPLVRAEDVVLAVEIVSPGSELVDTTVKPFEYADAGIPNFWLVDPAPPVTVTVYSLADGNYEESQRAERGLEVVAPCELRIDLAALSR